MKKKPTKLSLVIAIIMGCYFLYKGVSYLWIPDFETVGVIEIACGLFLVGYPVWMFFKKPKTEED